MGRTIRISVENGLCKWLDRLIRLRWLVALVASIIVIATSYFLPEFPSAIYLWVTIAIFIALNAFFWLYSRRLQPENGDDGYHAVFVHSQFAVDIVFLTVFLHFMGGLETPFFFFYLIYAVTASFLFTKSVSFGYVGFLNILYLLLIVFEWQEIIPHYNLFGFRSPLRFQQPLHIFTSSFSLAATSLLTAYFASTIMTRLIKREHELIKSNMACEVKTKELMEANRACELKTKELAEANRVRELKTKQLAELNERLAELDKARMQFIWQVTHELRAPVAAIQSYLRLILEGYIPLERQYEIIQKIERQALKQLDLISDLLQLARLDEAKILEKKAVSVDVKEVLETVLDMMTARVAEKNIRLEVQLDSELSPVMADPEHIKQLWTNLISNAVKYTDQGGNVLISLFQEDEHIVGIVEDTGIGISEEDLPSIFDDFFRADNARSMEREGTGLGLSIVKRIVENYNGDILVDSELGEGTKFIFKLPRKPSQSEPPDQSDS